jgi:hypothetical protein
MATNLPGTAADDDLAFLGGTFGTDFPKLSSGDFEGATVTRRARVIVALPEVSATVDVEAFVSGADFQVSGADLCATAAVSINSTTAAFKQFVISGVGLSPGVMIDIRITIAGDDTGGTGAVSALIGGAWLHCDIRG